MMVFVVAVLAYENRSYTIHPCLVYIYTLLQQTYRHIMSMCLQSAFMWNQPMKEIHWYDKYKSYNVFVFVFIQHRFIYLYI